LRLDATGQSTVKLVAPTSGLGPVVPQLKLMVAFVRTKTAAPVNGFVLDWFAKYWPSKPVPLPAAAELTKDALAMALLAAPAQSQSLDQRVARQVEGTGVKR